MSTAQNYISATNQRPPTLIPKPLAVGEIVPYLIEAGLLDCASVTDDEVTIQDVSRRHRNLAVAVTRSGGYLLKTGIDPERSEAIHHEAEMYQLAQSGGLPPSLRRNLPRFYLYDSSTSTLIIQLIAGARNLREHCARRGVFPIQAAGLVGRALATLHKISLDELSSEEVFRRPLPKPWIHFFSTPGSGIMKELSNASLGLLSVIQNNLTLADLLTRL